MTVSMLPSELPPVTPPKTFRSSAVLLHVVMLILNPSKRTPGLYIF